MLFYLFLIPIFFLFIQVYFWIADHYNIIDKPNHRSSHSEITIRGGGVVYLFAGLIAILYHPDMWIPLTGIFLIGIISFIDDIVTLSGRVRIVVHFISASLLIYSMKGAELDFLSGGLLLVLIIGIINAYNFMDGINGITGLYSLSVLAGLQFVNYKIINFIEPDFIWLPILASIVFLYYNFRKKAKCFAGDVGSVTVAFWIVFLILKLIVMTGDFKYILFLAVYGVDSVLTIVHRVILRQNIFDAHRLHFYQILVNELQIPHLIIAVLYALLQILIICYVVLTSGIYSFLIVLIPLVVTYIALKPELMKKKSGF